ncbi:hypothetical protein [Borrelia coriaceae]|uniref:hypothetical protein n=1 Tax=Borrelia coriaceae TaxID=144 RepID=UPI0004B25D78|nr:hypothetical protein [Borrelia coriaceae]
MSKGCTYYEKNKLAFLIILILALSLISCETMPEEGTCGNANISKGILKIRVRTLIQ